MTADNGILDGGMQPTLPETYRNRELQAQIEKLMAVWGSFESVQRFARKYGKPNSLRGYREDLDLYWRHLPTIDPSIQTVTVPYKAKLQKDEKKEDGKKHPPIQAANPDALVKDNAVCVYESKADRLKKRKHTDYLDRYVNVDLIELGVGYAARHHKVAAIRGFYLRNDSPLFGDFSLSEGALEEGRKTPKADDIREVLKALPLHHRTPLIMVWQGGIEPVSVLALRWGAIDLSGSLLRLDFVGRKRQKRPYFTFVGKDCINLLKIWRETWVRDMGKEPTPEDLVFYGRKYGPMSPGYLNSEFKETAMILHKQGLVSNGDPGAWHNYTLRHSYKSESEHAGARSGIVEYFMGHTAGISWVYNHRDELHPEDFEAEYLKIEPHLSLNPSEIEVERKVSARFEQQLAQTQGGDDGLRQGADSFWSLSSSRIHLRTQRLATLT